MKDAYHHGDLRNALLAAALQLIREQGPAGFTLREVARRAGVSHAAPYRHFRDKADLAAAIAAEGFLQMDRQMMRAVAAKRTPQGRLEAAGLAYVTFALRRPEHFRVMFAAPIDRALHPDAHAAGDQSFRRLVDLVSACQKAGQIDDGDPRQSARICWSQVHGIAQLAIDRQFPFKPGEVLAFTKRAIASLLKGLRA